MHETLCYLVALSVQDAAVSHRANIFGQQIVRLSAFAADVRSKKPGVQTQLARNLLLSPCFTTW
jgi:hypothetical protein